MQPKENKKLERRVMHFFWQGIQEFQLLQKNDHILVGISGGKDSLALLHLLSILKHNKKPNFKITALHVQVEGVGYLSDSKYLKQFCESFDVPFIQKSITLTSPSENTSSPCMRCSRLRRKILFDTAQEIDANKIALGHHQDDLLHTALLNLMYEGSFSTMPAMLQMQKFPMQIIRSLCKVQEQDLRLWAELHQYQKQLKLCPYEQKTKRSMVSELFKELEKQNNEVRFSMWHALEKAGKLTE